MSSVRQSAKREKTPEILSLIEMSNIIARMGPRRVWVMILIAAVIGLRRSEIRGLKWKDFDFDKLWVNFKRGVVRKHKTKHKTETSRKGLPITEELAEVLLEWRRDSPYRADADWVFASERKGGTAPVWLDMVLENYIRPAAVAAGVTKNFAWHTFRRSLSTALSDLDVPVKVISELLRNATLSTTFELYQQASAPAKRAAQNHMKELFAA